jgi:hypothetical protein
MRRALLLRSIALGCAYFLCLSCSRDLDGLDLPWPPAAPSAAPQAAAPPEASIDCDDLPSLTPEEAAGPPFAPPRLEKSAPRSGPPPSFNALPDVTLRDAVADKVDALDDAYFRRTGKHITVTSGTRDAARQAKAMYKMLRLGGDILKLYKNKEAAREVKEAYDTGRAAKKDADDAVSAIYAVLQAQIARGVYISAHLRAGAVDVRIRDMSAAQRKAFTAVATGARGVTLLEESTPPHFHLQIE